MAWNGSDSTVKVEGLQKKAPHRSQPSTSSSLKRGALAGALVVALAVGTVLIIVRHREKPTAVATEQTKPATIKEVAPSIAPVHTNAATNARAVAAKEKKAHRVGEIWYDEDGHKKVTMKYKGKIVDMPIQERTDLTLPKTRIFQHTSENAIANLLRIEPGQGTFGNRTYKGFAKDFLESLKVPIIPTASDDEWTRQLKKDVNEAKIELKAAYDRGEDIEEIMRNTREEYKKLAAVKRQLMAEVNKMVHAEGVTADDVDDITAAANKMLAEKGIAPIKTNPIIKKKLQEMKGENQK